MSNPPLPAYSLFMSPRNVKAAAVGLFYFLRVSAKTAIVASTTHTLAGATSLTSMINVISTVANVGDALRLPTLMPGQEVTIYNQGANAASIYPSDGSTAIDGGAAGAAVPLSASKRCRYICVAPGVIISAQLGAPAA